MRKTLILALFAGLAALVAPAEGVLAQNEQFFPALVYRSGPYAPNGIPFANGYGDYLRLVNERDGGINGVKITTEECETGYATDRGVECYERLKGKGPTGAALFVPLSTGITYALMDKALADKIPLLTSGYGRSESADGNVVRWAFPILGTYWDAGDDPDRIPREGAGRLGQAEGQEDRRRLSRFAVRQGADPGSAGDGKAARVHPRADAGHPSRRRAEGDMAADPPERGPISCCSGAGA